MVCVGYSRAQLKSLSSLLKKIDPLMIRKKTARNRSNSVWDTMAPAYDPPAGIKLSFLPLFMFRHNNGHVTKIQASQCLHTLALTDDPEEIRVTNHNSSFLCLSLF